MGDNPAAYQGSQDKWISVWVAFSMDYLFPALPFLLGAIPWLWLLWRKVKKKPISKKILIITVLISLGLAVIGIYLPDLYLYILAGLAVRELYGT